MFVSFGEIRVDIIEIVVGIIKIKEVKKLNGLFLQVQDRWDKNAK